MEAQVAARLSHPNIVNVYDVVDEENLHYIVMELIEDHASKTSIEKKGFLESKRSHRYCHPGGTGDCCSS